MSTEKMFTADKFLGLNEEADGQTELKMGEASKMENFFITDNYNLKTRDGVQRVDFTSERGTAHILASWTGHVGEDEYLVVADLYNGADRLLLYGENPESETVGYELLKSQTGLLGLSSASDATVKIFTFGGKLWVMSNEDSVYWDGEQFAVAEPYIPLVTVGADPAGGGTSLENLNLLSSKRRMEYNGDGETTAYVLPSEAISITAIEIDNEAQTVSSAGSYDTSTHTFTFTTAPIKGVSNVEITYDTDATQATINKAQITNCKLAEAYNGSTDTRLFVAGDGTNIAYYSGVTEAGDATPMYFPAMNEVAVDMSDSPITGMVRHYSKLMVFKPDGTYTISYEPVTLEDGSTIAGFYLRSANREFGHEVLGQVQTVNNYPRTVTKDGVYEWRITTSYYKDERYAKRISDAVNVTLKNADTEKIVTCDDNFSKTYYMFLNDDEGTVLVNRYALDGQPWCMYKGTLFTDVKHAIMLGDKMLFATSTELFYFESATSKDASIEVGGKTQQITAVWESGFYAFGADYQRKYSSYIYVSILPQSVSDVTVTAVTDKRASYNEKVISTRLFGFANLNFANFSFDLNDRPRIKRVRLKVKKFVYYKLIFKVETSGATATILGYDQLVRFGSMAK